MKKRQKKIYSDYKPLILGILHALGIIAIFDWVIFPGLTTKNTIVNIFSLMAGVTMLGIVGVLIYENFFKENKNDSVCKTQEEDQLGKKSSEPQETDNKD